MNEQLSLLLRDRGVSETLIEEVVDSGYFVRGWFNPATGQTCSTVSDRMYGSKQFTSSFEVDQFVSYLQGKKEYDPLPAFVETTVHNQDDLLAVLADPRRQRYLANGSMSFRGQPKEYRLKRKIPNPRRRDKDGHELSILPGLYRQSEEVYSFARPFQEREPWSLLLHELEPNVKNPVLASAFSYDMVRTEQHYATQTAGLDVSFDLRTALFFAVFEFQWRDDGTATYVRVKQGEHQGIIYCFRFRDPSVTETEFLIRDFDFFKTNRPERILRQRCGLPLLGEYERNIAITDIDCIIRLAPDFECDPPSLPMYLFPSELEDSFYRVLLTLKEKYPEEMSTVVEYEWARCGSRGDLRCEI